MGVSGTWLSQVSRSLFLSHVPEPPRPDTEATQ